MKKNEEQARAQQIEQVLQRLNEQEKALLNKVLEVESAKIHQSRPQVIDDLCKAVNGAIKF